MPNSGSGMARFAGRSLRRSLVPFLAMLALACNDVLPPEPPPAPASYTVSLSSLRPTLAKGEFGTNMTLSVVRTNFTGEVTLSVENLPIGVTASFYPVSPISSGSSNIRLSVAGDAPTGTFTDVLVRGVASGLADRTTQLMLTITAAPYLLTLSSATLSIAQGGAEPTTTVNLLRNNFTDPVTLVLGIGNYIGGLPEGVTAAFEPNATTGNSSMLTLTVGAAALPGVYDLVVWSSTQTRSFEGVPLALTITPAVGPETPVAQWAIGATASTEYTAAEWSATQATGAPNVTACEDDGKAWASLSPDGVDWLELTYPEPVRPSEIRIHETYAVGSIVKVEVKDGSGGYQTVYTALPSVPPSCSRILTISVTGVTAKVSAVRVTVDQRVRLDWNEIDAVQLIGYR